MGDIVTIPDVMFPNYGTFDYTTINTLALTGSGQYVVYGLRAPKAGQVIKVGFLLSSVTVTGTLQVSLRAIDSDGQPVGIIDQFYNLVNPSVGWQSGTFNIPRTLVLGESFCVVIALITAGNLSIGCIGTPGAANRNIFQGTNYVIFNVTKQQTISPIVDLQWADGERAVIHGVYPVNSLSTFGPPTVDIGLRYKPAAAIRIKGVWARINIVSLTSDTFEFKLWDALDAVVRSVTVLPKQSVLTAAGIVPFISYFATPYVVPANTIIHATMHCLTGTPGISHGIVHGADPRIREALPGGKEFWMAVRIGSTWDDFGTPNSAYWPHMGLIIDGVDEGLGGAVTTRIISSSDIFALDVRSKV